MPTASRSTSSCRPPPASQRLAPEKDGGRIEGAMARHARCRSTTARTRRQRYKSAPRFAPAGQSTQMIVGADAANDGDIVARASTLYDRFRLRRVYYSAFSPIPDASAVLPLKRPPLMREHRLYQSDWLMRFYGFTPARGGQRGRRPTACCRSTSIPSSPGRSSSATASRSTSTAPPRELLLRVPGPRHQGGRRASCRRGAGASCGSTTSPG